MVPSRVVCTAHANSALEGVGSGDIDVAVLSGLFEASKSLPGWGTRLAMGSNGRGDTRIAVGL